ncbi:hypothetical protein CVU75_02760, partial [Candidatus Dependentiae bacterium HGW-Dependentiae-1]
ARLKKAHNGLKAIISRGILRPVRRSLVQRLEVPPTLKLRKTTDEGFYSPFISSFKNVEYSGDVE